MYTETTPTPYRLDTIMTFTSPRDLTAEENETIADLLDPNIDSLLAVAETLERLEIDRRRFAVTDEQIVEAVVALLDKFDFENLVDALKQVREVTRLVLA